MKEKESEKNGVEKKRRKERTGEIADEQPEQKRKTQEDTTKNEQKEKDKRDRNKK